MDESIKPVNASSRYRQLDSLRGIAALFVFLFHYVLIFTSSPAWVGFSRYTPLGIMINGRASVMFFFVLSGFVLSLPYMNGNDHSIKLVPFYIKRIFRIFPAFIASILIALLLKTYFYDAKNTVALSQWTQQFWHWEWNKSTLKEIIKTFTLIYPGIKANYFDPVIWSLVVEFQMSVILPFFIIVASRTKALYNILLLPIIIWMVYYGQAYYLGMFYLGILLAKYKDELTGYFEGLNKLAITAFILLGLFLYNVQFEFNTSGNDFYYSLKFYLKDYINSFGAGLFIIIALKNGVFKRILHFKPFLFLGDISTVFIFCIYPC